MPNRLTADQILNKALDLADSAVLDAKDRPTGTLVASPLTLDWLQEALDLFHKKFPFSADIKSVAVTLAQSSNILSCTGGQSNISLTQFIVQSSIFSSFTTGDTSTTITLGAAAADTNYGISITPSWNTSFYVDPSTLTTSQFTVQFSNPATAGDSFRYVITYTGAIPAGGLIGGLPSDFILDYNNGIILDNNKGRMQRRGLGSILNRTTDTTGKPVIYSIRGTTIQYWPTADQLYTGNLYYYALPAAITLGTGFIPVFPDDYILVRYVWLSAQEYHRVAQPGTALAFAEAQIKELQKAGIGPESEEDQIGIDPQFAQERPVDLNSWMGKPAL